MWWGVLVWSIWCIPADKVRANAVILLNSTRIEFSSTQRVTLLTDQRTVGVEQTCFISDAVGPYRPTRLDETMSEPRSHGRVPSLLRQRFRSGS